MSLDSNKVDGFQLGVANGGCCEQLVMACSCQKFGGGGFRVLAALPALVHWNSQPLKTWALGT